MAFRGFGVILDCHLQTLERFWVLKGHCLLNICDNCSTVAVSNQRGYALTNCYHWGRGNWHNTYHIRPQWEEVVFALFFKACLFDLKYSCGVDKEREAGEAF